MQVLDNNFFFFFFFLPKRTEIYMFIAIFGYSMKNAFQSYLVSEQAGGARVTCWEGAKWTWGSKGKNPGEEPLLWVAPEAGTF